MALLKEEEMLGMAENAVASALRQGANEAEAFLYKGLTATVGIERGQVTKSSRIIDKGLGLRAIVNKAIGFSYTNMFESREGLEQTVARALAAAKSSKPDKDWSGLPSKKPFPSVGGNYDDKIAELHSEELVKIASAMLDSAEQADKRVISIEGGSGASVLSVAIANSNGISSFDKGTVIECSLETIAKDRNQVTPSCVEFNISRKYDIDPEWVGKEAARMAVSALRPKSVETRKFSVIFTQFALQQLLSYTLINAVKADHVQRNQSALKGKIGDKVASDSVTIHDDGLLECGIRTAKFDGEGIPQQETVVVEKGMLRGFIYDNYTAKKEGRESTGNAGRAGYLSTPDVEATNFHILPGNKSPEKLTSEVKDGLIVYYLQGAHSSNPASGEFSVVATPAWRIKNGEIAHSTKGVMVAGNIYELLKDVSDLANNERKIGQLVAPWVKVENVKVIGK